MGGGASKQTVTGMSGESKRGGFGFSARAFSARAFSARGLSLRALSLKRANNFEAYLKFIQAKPFAEVTAAAIKIQSAYRRTLAKRKLANIKLEKVTLETSAKKYLEDMKDARKNLPGKLKMDSALGLIKDTLLTPVSVRNYGEIPYFSFPNRSMRESSLYSCKTPRKSPRTTRKSGFNSPPKSSRQGSHRVGFEEDHENEQDEEGSTKVLMKTVELFESAKPINLATSSRKPPSSKPSNKFSRYSQKARRGSAKESAKSSKRTSVRNSTRSSAKPDVDEDDFGRGINMTALAEEEDESEDEGFGTEDPESGREEDPERTFEKIYPMIGYVIKTRFLNSQKKVFINILHNAHVNKIICSPFREYIDTSHYDDDGYVQSVSVAICDIIIPSNEFHKAFKFVEGKGLVSRTFTAPMKSPRKGRGQKPKEIDMKKVLAEQCLTYLNSLSHCLDESNPPIAGLLDCDDYTIDESFLRLPKMKKMYYGTVPLYYYNKKEQILDFYQPLSWSYLVKMMPNSSNKNPMPETYFNHYFIDPFTSQVADNGDAPSAAMASFSVDDPKRRVFPPDLQYPMALSYQCLKGDFDPKNPMKANYSQLAGSTASSLRIGMLSDAAAGLGKVASRSTDNAKVADKKPSRPLTNKQPFTHEINLDDDDDDIPIHQKQFLEGLGKLKTGYQVYMDLSFGIMTLYLKRSGSSLPPGTSSLSPNGYNTNNVNNKGKNRESVVNVPYGETFVARIALCNYVLNTSYDATNHIFYLHIETEFTSEHSQYNQFMISHYVNDVSENIDLSKLTFQFPDYTELMTMQLLIERHAFYCKHASTYTHSLIQQSSMGGSSMFPSIGKDRNGGAGGGGILGIGRNNTPGSQLNGYSFTQLKYEQGPIGVHPPTKFFALVERFSLFPLSRQKRYWKIDRGLVGVFEDDMKINPNWKNAIEIIALNNKRFEIVWHRKIVRLRKFMTKILLIDDKTKKIREFFFKGDGEIDQELQGIMSCVNQHIQYANAKPFRYQYHYIEALGLLNRPTNSAADHLTVHGFDTQMQIIVPDPHTSDDDSDVEDPAAMTAIDVAGDSTLQNELNPAPPLQSILKTGTGGGNGAAPHRMVSQRSTGNLTKNNSKIVYGSYFKVIRYKGKGKDRAPELTGPESLNDDNDDESDDGKVKIPTTTEQIIDHWQQRLSEYYSDFSKLFFHCRLYFIEELDLILFFQDFKLVSMMKIAKILEKPTVQSLNAPSGGNSNSTLGGAPNGSNNLSLITGNILRRNSTPMKVINKPSTSAKESQAHVVTLDIVPPVGTKVSTKGSQRALAATMSAKLYNLDSDDSEEEDENSDRDYEENDAVSNYFINKSAKAQGSTRTGVTFSTNNNATHQNEGNLAASVWIFKVLSDDGRTFRLKFHQKQSYDKVTKFYYQRCIKPVVKRDPTIFKENEILAAEPTLPEIIFDMDATKKHARLLRPNEKVIGSGTVLKHEKTLPLMNAKDLAAVPKQRRVLLVTDAPRMIFIDTIGGIVRGHVDFPSDSKNEVKLMDGNDFEITVNGNLHRFTSAELPEKDPKYWVLRTRQAMSLAGSK